MVSLLCGIKAARSAKDHNRWRWLSGSIGFLFGPLGLLGLYFYDRFHDRSKYLTGDRKCPDCGCGIPRGDASCRMCPPLRSIQPTYGFEGGIAPEVKAHN